MLNLRLCEGMGIMTHLLARSQPEHLTVELLAAVEKLCNAVQPSENLWLESIACLLLNFRLWSRADMQTQRAHVKSLIKFAKVFYPSP